MAEKEERICVELLKDDFCDSCDNRGKLRNCCCYEKQEYDERYQKSLPRQEAIERMKNADIRNHWECQKQGRRPTNDESYGAMLEALINGGSSNE